MKFLRFRTPEHFFLLGYIPLVVGIWFMLISGAIHRYETTRTLTNTNSRNINSTNSTNLTLCPEAIGFKFQDEYRDHRDEVKSLGPFLLLVALLVMFCVYKGFSRRRYNPTPRPNGTATPAPLRLVKWLHFHGDTYLDIIAHYKWRSLFGITAVFLLVLGTSLILFSYAVVVHNNYCVWDRISKIVGSISLIFGLYTVYSVLRTKHDANTTTPNNDNNNNNANNAQVNHVASNTNISFSTTDIHSAASTSSSTCTSFPSATTSPWRVTSHTFEPTAVPPQDTTSPHSYNITNTDPHESLPPLPSYEEAIAPSYEEAMRMPRPQVIPDNSSNRL